MKAQSFAFLINIFLIFTFCADARAFLAHGEINFSIEIVINTIDGDVKYACKEQEIVGRSGQTHLLLGISDDHSVPLRGWEEIFPMMFCANDKNGQVTLDLDNSQVTPDLLAKVDAKWQVVRQMEDERVLVLEISIEFMQGAESSETDSSLAGHQVKRKMFFSEDANAFIPVQGTPDGMLQSLGVKDIFVRFGAAVDQKPQETVYGTLVVMSGDESAEVLLDGFRVGKISPNQEMEFGLISAGLRDVSLRFDSGEIARQTTRVVAGRTVLVNFSQFSTSKAKARFGLESLGENEHGFEEYRRNSDGGIVVRIPEGEFLMGNKDTERNPLEHQVYISNFLMDKMGVSWGQYKQFAADTGVPMPPHKPYWGILDDHPAIYVTWEEANNYCEWAGGRLPTEAEREKAARGTDGRDFPWGDEKPNKDLGVFRTSWGYGSTGPVAALSAGASPYGLLNMGGNVWEWCSDWYDDEYYANSPFRDPKGPAMGRAHVVRGGSWDSRPDVLSASCRSWGHRGYRDGDFGFRCAMNDPP